MSGVWCETVCVLVWLSGNCFEALGPRAPFSTQPTSSRDRRLCKLSTSRPRLSFSSCFSASSCCSSCTWRATEAQPVSRKKCWATGGPALPSPSPYLSLQAVKGAGLRLWQLIEEVGTGLGSRLGVSPAHLLLSNPLFQPQMSAVHLLHAVPTLFQTLFLATNSFIHSLKYLFIYKYLSSIYYKPGNHPRCLPLWAYS